MDDIKKRKKIKIAFIASVIFAVILFAIAFYPDDNYIGMDDFTFKTLAYEGENFIILKPTFTESAYGPNGFYWYYDGRCGEECLTIPIQKGELNRWGAFNLRSITAFSALKWPMMEDLEAHKMILKDPDFLLQYDHVILLHNEYVTSELYHAIRNHPYVIYMMPNALYAQITYDQTKNTITLIQGHDYPTEEFKNGFGWEYDNSIEEYDLDCIMYKWRDVDNGKQLSCTPEKILIKRPHVLLDIKGMIK